MDFPTRFLVKTCLLLWLCTGGMVASLAAQDLPEDLTALNLEELLQIELIPTGVLGSHIHAQGEWMVGYRFVTMQMGEKEGDSFDDFMVLPTNMRMDMHMVEVMYGVTDHFTVMLMMPYKRLSMDHVTRQGTRFTTQTQGVGDLQVMMHYAFYRATPHYMTAVVNVGLPTGEINARDDTPAGRDQKLPYPMQMGSGTLDLAMGFNYIYQEHLWSGGMHSEGQFRLGRNRNDYRLGNTYHLGVWLARRLNEWVAPGLHLDGHWTGTIHGADPELNPNLTPTADPHRQGGLHVSLLPTLTFYVPRGRLRGHRLSLVGDLPAYHSHHGVSLERQWKITLAWQWTF